MEFLCFCVMSFLVIGCSVLVLVKVVLMCLC